MLNRWQGFRNIIMGCYFQGGVSMVFERPIEIVLKAAVCLFKEEGK